MILPVHLHPEALITCKTQTMSMSCKHHPTPVSSCRKSPLLATLFPVHLHPLSISIQRYQLHQTRRHCLCHVSITPPLSPAAEVLSWPCSSLFTCILCPPPSRGTNYIKHPDIVYVLWLTGLKAPTN